MASPAERRLRRRAELRARMAALADGALMRCTMLGCGRPPQARAGTGLSQTHCSYHIQHLGRHGSLWHPTYLAGELSPYLKAVSHWLSEHRGDFYLEHAVSSLSASLYGAGEAEIATRLRGLSAHKRARVAFARLRDAKVPPERLLAIYLAVSGLMRQDAGTHATDEFRIVQVAKAAHRLASGYHRTWDFPRADGTTAPVYIHAYPRSSGRVLRLMGAEIERACEVAAAEHLDDILALKDRLYGRHPSAEPTKTGWKPLWRIRLDETRAANR